MKEDENAFGLKRIKLLFLRKKQDKETKSYKVASDQEHSKTCGPYQRRGITLLVGFDNLLKLETYFANT